MKLVVQVPCYNEQDNVLEVLKTIPKKINGVDEILVVVIDDFSSDNTIKIATDFGVKVLKSNSHIGLANVFKMGVEYALMNNADILVNIDGDNQYNANDIKKLIGPIVNNESDITIGSRPISDIDTFSFSKKILQKIGSFMVRFFSSINIDDAPSGFRAFNKKALLSMNIFNSFTYTIESIIQAKYKNLIIKNVKIGVNNQKNRKSKLFKNNFDYIFKQAKNLIRFFAIYRPFRFFSSISFLFFISGLVLGFRYLYFFFSSDGTGHIQSLILCAILLIISFMLLMLAFIGDLLSINRKILEDIQYEARLKKYKK